MEKGQVDCGVFQEKKLTKVVYTREDSGFWIMLAEAPSAHRSGGAIFYHEAEHFAIEELRLHGPNSISFQLVTGRCWWHVIGGYIAPSDALTIENVDVVIRYQPYKAKLLVLIDLNANLSDPEGTLRGESIVDKLAAAGIMDMGLYFFLWGKPWFKDRCMWSMRRDGQEVRSWTDYIVRKYHRQFEDMAVQNPRHNLSHYMVPGCLRGEPTKELMNYLY